MLSTVAKKLRVLVIDDHETCRRVFVEYCRKLGHTSQEAASVSEALEFLPSTDLLITDLRLPDVSGSELICQLRHGHFSTALQPLPAILVSADYFALQRTPAAKLGSTVVLLKPFRLSDLSDAIKAVIGP